MGNSNTVPTTTVTHYDPKFSTYVFPVTDHNYRKTVDEALGVLYFDMMLQIIAPDEGKAEKGGPNNSMIEDMKKKALEGGIVLTPEMIESLQGVMDTNITTRDRKPALLSKPKILDDKGEVVRETKVVMNWLGWIDEPGTKQEKKNGVKSNSQIHRIRLAKAFVTEDVDADQPLYPLADGTYKYWWPTVGSDILHTKKQQMGCPMECEALYDRKNRTGTPVFKPSWITRQENGCAKCIYASHNKNNWTSTGVDYKDSCKVSRERVGLVFGTLNGVEVAVFVIWSTASQLDYFLNAQTFVGKKPSYQYLSALKDFRMIHEVAKKKRVVSEASDIDQLPLFTRTDDPVKFMMCSTVSGHIKKYYEAKLAPQKEVEYNNILPNPASSMPEDAEIEADPDMGEIE